MNAVLENICAELDQIDAAVNSVVPTDEPFNVAQNNWSFPGLTRSELAEAASSLAALIRSRGREEVGEGAKRLQDYPRRLKYLRTSLLPNLWGNAAVAVPSFLATLDGLRKALAQSEALADDNDLAQQLKRSTTRLRAIEAQLNDVEPRSANIKEAITQIERAYEAADQLPTDIESLQEARKTARNLLDEIELNQSKSLHASESAVATGIALSQKNKEASQILAECASAYSAATSVGLSAAFSERSKALDRSMWYWVVGLMGALVIGAVMGAQQLRELVGLAKDPNVAATTLTINLVLSLLSVGAPVWFGWLATKQIGQRFRLSEDYAFKASVSRAYEGYRKEAARFDSSMEERLLGSALARFDEQPLRLIESSSHGSPWHELASSDVVKDAIKSVPEFPKRIIEMAKAATGKLRSGTSAEALLAQNSEGRRSHD